MAEDKLKLSPSKEYNLDVEPTSAAEPELVSGSSKRLVVLPAAGMGHIRSMMQLALSLMSLMGKLEITFLTFSTTYDNVVAELDRQNHLTVEQRESMSVRGYDDVSGLERELGALFSQSQPAASEVGDKRKPIDLIIYDLFPFSIPSIITSLAASHSAERPPCLYLCPVSATFILRMCGPADRWGRWAGFAQRYKGYKARGMSDDEAGRKALANAEGRLLQPPDLPKMYDCESINCFLGTISCLLTSRSIMPDITDFLSQTSTISAAPFPPSYHWKIPAVSAATRESDGLISYGTQELETWATEQVEGSLGVPVYSIGPQLSESIWEANSPLVRTKYTIVEREILDFLDETEVRYGKRSAAYISLGSVVWPYNRPELITYLVDSLLETCPSIPFILVTPAPGAAETISSALRKKVEESGRGLIVPWAPQLTVLQHDAVRFFVSHAGAGSSVEAIMAGMPAVCIPFTSDQPFWAAQPSLPPSQFSEDVAALNPYVHRTIVSKKWRRGIQLHQLNTMDTIERGSDVKLGSGDVFYGTEEAIRAEMASAWTSMRGAEYDLMRRSMRGIRSVILESKRSGAGHQALEQIVSLISG